MKKWLFSVGWALMAVLVLAALLLNSKSKQLLADPKASSYGASGATALADLLKLRGYDIAIDRRANPKLGPKDAVIAFEVGEDHKWKDEDIKDTQSFLEGKVKAGTTVIWLPLPTNFEEGSKLAGSPVSVTRIDGQIRKLSGESTASVSDDSNDSVALATSQDDPFVTAIKRGKGYDIRYATGIGLTNRFLDRSDNAQFLLETLKAYAPNARRMVFTEATFGEAQQPGLLETIGPWAEGSWYQLLFVFIIVVITLNSRFGLPLEVRPVQTGSRELVDALTDTMVRAKATSLTLEAALKSSDQRLRQLLKLPRDASEGERDRILPPNLALRLAELKAATTMRKVPSKEALRLIAAAEGEIEALTVQLRGKREIRGRGRNLL